MQTKVTPVKYTTAGIEMTVVAVCKDSVHFDCYQICTHNGWQSPAYTRQQLIDFVGVNAAELAVFGND
jgi:hypothetical protein